MNKMTNDELDQVAGGTDVGGVGGVAGMTSDEIDSVAGGDGNDVGGVGGVAGYK